MAKLSQQELMDLAYSHVPASGEITFSALAEAIRASGESRAVEMIPALKKAGLVKARLEADANGVIVGHFYSRTGGA